MSRSRARKNRFKYKTLRRIGFFKVFVMDYPNSNGNIYPSLNFNASKNSKKFIRELQHPQGSFFSISSHVSEGYVNSWTEGPIPVLSTEPQATSDVEWYLDAMCGLLGVDKENLVLDQPVLFASSVKDSVDYTVKLGKPITRLQEPSDTDFARLDQPVLFASSVEKSVSRAIKNLHEIKRERFRGPDISKLSETKADEIPPCPWPTKLDLAGVWSNPVDVTPMQGHSFEEVKTEKMLNLARALKKSNTREYLKKAADILGEDIEVDDIFLGDGLKMFRVREDMWNMDEVKEDSPEWVVVMIAFCRHPELSRRLRAHGSTSTEVRRSALNDSSPAVISDVYHLFDTTNIKVADAFKPIPFSVQHEEHIGEAIIGFTAKMLDTTRSDWTLPDDK